MRELYERWKPIKGYEGLYEVSNFGNVKSLDFVNIVGGRYKRLKKGKILHQAKRGSSGYYFVLLYKNKKRKCKNIHRLVAEAFIPNPDNLPYVNHKDETRTNNFVFINDDGSVNYEKSNLEWCTIKYNNNYGTVKQRQSLKKLNRKDQSKPINQYSVEGTFIKEWPSVREIERTLGYNRGNIIKCCKHKQHHNTSYGSIWEYAS